MRNVKAEESFECEDGVYYSKIVEIEDFAGSYGPSVRIFFRLDPKTGSDGVVNGIFPMKATPKNKTGSLLLACFGECVPEKVYDLDRMLNSYVYIQVVNVTRADGTFPQAKRAIWPPPGAAAVAPAAQPVQSANSAGAEPPSMGQPTDNIPF